MYLWDPKKYYFIRQNRTHIAWNDIARGGRQDFEDWANIANPLSSKEIEMWRRFFSEYFCVKCYVTYPFIVRLLNSAMILFIKTDR